MSTPGWVAALRGSHKWLNAAKELPPASWGHLDTALKAASGLRGAEILPLWESVVRLQMHVLTGEYLVPMTFEELWLDWVSMPSVD